MTIILYFTYINSVYYNIKKKIDINKYNNFNFLTFCKQKKNKKESKKKYKIYVNN